MMIDTVIFSLTLSHLISAAIDNRPPKTMQTSQKGQWNFQKNDILYVYAQSELIYAGIILTKYFITQL